MPELPGDWEVDREGNLTPPGELQPDTDEFGRDDPATLERERRRREREARREGGARKKQSSGGSTGGFSRLLGKRSRRDAAATGAAADPPAAAEPPSAEPTPEGPPASPERPPATARTSFWRRRFAALVLALVGILLLWFLVALFQPFAGSGEGDGEIVVNVPDGASAGEVADILTEQNIVSNGSLFQLRLRLAGKTDEILPGRYVLASGMSYGTAIERLTEESSDGKITFTIPEGLSLDQIAPLTADVGLEGDYLAATETPPPGFNPAKYGAKSASLEGFLFPATYELDPGASVNELVLQKLDAFEQNFASVDLSYAKKKNLTPYDVLIIASMIDKEVQVAKERPLVAAVIYNRLSKGMALFIDATTRYETQNYTEPLTNEVLQADTPYNTRTNFGLTPTPIGNPGLAAIKAAARPAKVNHLFYVVKPGTCGEHNFTASEAEFEKFAAEYQAALEEQGGSPTEC